MTNLKEFNGQLGRLDERLAAFQETTDRRLERIEEKLDNLNEAMPNHDARITSLERSYSRVWTVISGLIVGLIITMVSFAVQNLHLLP